MADQQKQPSLFSFGATSSSGSTPSIFGTSSGNTLGSAAGKQSGSLFGSGAAGSSTGSGSLFGSTQPAAATSQSSAPAAGTSSLFGNLGQNSSSSSGASGGLFSTPNKPAESGSAFGAAKPATTGGLFGNVASPAASSVQQGATTPAQNKPAFSFGNASTTPAGPPPASGSGTSSLFGNLSKGPETKSSLFGSTQQSSTGTMNAPDSGAAVQPVQPKPSGLFGGGGGTGAPTPASGQGTSSLFGNQGGNASAQSDASKTQASSLFGNLGGQQPASQPSETQWPMPKPTSSAEQTSSLFGSTTSASQPSAAPASGLFSGAAATSGGTASNPFAPAATTQSATSSGSAASAAPASSLFAGLGAKPAATQAASSSAAAPSLFTMGQPAKPASPVTQPAASSSAAAPSFSTASAAPSLSLTSGQQPAASSAAAQAPAQATAGAKTDGTTAGANLGASTTAPKPTPQSRLKNKSMDEIITRWTTDLNKYQKEFQSQASTVAKWDRMLVENSDKIQKLYGHTLEAERATIEVERQLAAVENDQAELEYWLEHYEQEVDKLMSTQVGQSDSLSGPDQERERTYKLAEKLSDRLDEMNKDLTAMVEEINDASSNLSKTNKPDDPLSQIVRVLNGHLTQLQQIDQGTAALQAKVQAAQKATRQLGASGARNGLGSDAADDFYRSYMGRR